MGVAVGGGGVVLPLKKKCQRFNIEPKETDTDLKDEDHACRGHVNPSLM